MATKTETTSRFEKRKSHIDKSLQQYSNGELSFEQGKERVGSIIESLKTCQDFSTKEVGHSLATISLLPAVFCADAASSEMGRFLSIVNYTEVFVTVIHNLEACLMPENFSEESQSCFNVYIACYGFLSYSGDQESQRIPEAFGKCGGVEVMMRIVKILDESIHKTHGHHEIVSCALGIFANCITYCAKNRPLYRRANLIEYFESKLCSRYLSVRIPSVLTLSQISDEQVTERISSKLDCVLLLVELLRRAVDSDDHYVRVVGEFDEILYSAQELTKALSKLAVNDVNKLAIQKCGGISILFDMLRDGFSNDEDEDVEALRLLWILVSMESVKRDDEILDNLNYFQTLTMTKRYCWYSIREAATYILWEIRNHNMDFSSLPEDPSLEEPRFYLATPATEDEKPKSGCIVISYQFESGPKALYIRDKLESSGYNVWMSEFPLKERSLEQKVRIISQSSIMLACITENYKHEPSCRADVSYANEQGKTIIPLLMDSEYQPDGWIETLLGTDAKNHRFCANKDMDKNLQGVMEELSDNGNTKSKKAIGHKLKSMLTRFRTALDSSKSSRDTFLDACERNLRYWSSQRVQTWLKDNGLEQVALPPDICQGIQLMHMYEHCCKAINTFTEQLQSDFGVDIKTVIKFAAALCKLFR